MALPTITGRGPNRQPTHKPLDHGKLMKIGGDIEDEADGEPVTFEIIDDYASTQGVGHGAIFCAVAMTTEMSFARETDVLVTVCGGKCQSWGAAEVLEGLADLRIARDDSGETLFDIAAKSCLDACEEAVAVTIETPWGNTKLNLATKDKITEAVTEVLSAE